MSGKKIRGGEVEQYFQWVSRLPLLSAQEELELARRFRETGDSKLRERLITANLRFVAKVAFEYETYGFPVLDLIQEGNIGLLKAVDNFDPERGFRLISYGVWWIRACIHDHILKNWSLVKLGTTQQERAMFNKLISARRRSSRMVDGESGSNHSEIAQAVGATPAKVASFEQRMHRQMVSLDGPADPTDRGSSSLHELFAAPEGDAAGLYEERSLAQTRAEVLTRALERLPERERLILRERHLTGRKVTFRELGDELGLSKERIRQLENRALASLRRLISALPGGGDLVPTFG